MLKWLLLTLWVLATLLVFVAIFSFWGHDQYAKDTTNQKKWERRAWVYILTYIFVFIILPMLLASSACTSVVLRTDATESDLQAFADSCLPLFDNMPSVRVVVRDEPIEETRTMTYQGPDGQVQTKEYKRRADAYYHPAPEYSDGRKEDGMESYIVLKKIMLEHSHIEDVHTVIKHELTHAWIDWKNIPVKDSHGPEFQDKLYQVGVRSRGWDIHEHQIWAELEYGWRPWSIGLSIPIIGFSLLFLYDVWSDRKAERIREQKLRDLMR